MAGGTVAARASPVPPPWTNEGAEPDTEGDWRSAPEVEMSARWESGPNQPATGRQHYGEPSCDLAFGASGARLGSTTLAVQGKRARAEVRDENAQPLHDYFGFLPGLLVSKSLKSKVSIRARSGTIRNALLISEELESSDHPIGRQRAC